MADSTKFCVSELVYSLTIDYFFSSFRFGAFGDHDYAEVSSPLLSLLNIFAYFVYFVGLFRNKYGVGSSRNSRFQSYPAGVSSHNFNYNDSMVSLCCGVEPVKGFSCNRYSCVKAKSVVSASQIVINSFRHRNAWKPPFVNLLSHSLGVVSSYYN